MTNPLIQKGGPLLEIGSFNVVLAWGSDLVLFDTRWSKKSRKKGCYLTFFSFPGGD